MTDPTTTREALCRLLAATWESDPPSLPEPVPWSDLAHLARLERVEPLLHAAMHSPARRGTDSSAFALAMPAELQQSWARAYYQLAQRNLLHKQDLEPILQALAPSGVPVLLIKGLALAETLYGNVALRPMSDFDLVVPRDRVPAASEIVADLGYVPYEVELAPGAHLAYHIQQGFHDPQKEQTFVSIHWHLLDVPYYLRRVPMTWFWERSDPAQIGRHPVRVLNAEANLLYLAAHLALHHRFEGLRWFVDLALLVHQHHETLDWDAVLRAAQDFELLLVLREILDRLAANWPALPLDEARERLHALTPGPFERRLFRLLTAEPRGPLLDFYTDVVCLPDLPARLRFVLSNAFPQRSYMTRRYGVRSAWQLPVWYAYRLGTGLVKLVRTLPQVLRLRSG